MTNIEHSEYKSTTYSGNVCAKCSVNGSVRKYTFVFRKRYKAKLCAPCIQTIGGSQHAADWLDKHVIFTALHKFYFSKHNKTQEGEEAKTSPTPVVKEEKK